MTTRQQGTAAIKAHEGLRLQAYPDPASGGEPWTIGWGHTGGVKRGDIITIEQAEQFLAEDIETAQRGIRGLVKVPLTEGQLWALTSFVFNLGVSALAKSTLLRKLNARDYAGAANEFGRWINAAGKPMPGLVRRRSEERAMFLSGGSVHTLPAPAPKPEPVKEAPVAPIIAVAGKSLLVGLAKTLISGFMPLAAEKIEREIRRHTDKPEVVEQVTDAVITAAKVATGLEDPIEAVAEARKDPEVLAQVEASVLDKLASMAPLLERMAAIDLADKAATEASYDAAAKRAAGNPNDQDTYLTKSIVGMTIGLLVVAAALTGLLAWLKVSETILMAVFGLFNAGALLVLSKFGTRYDHRYGSSTGSAAKDVVIRNLTNGKQP